MNIRSFLFDYGEQVEGYSVGVVNEREVRAASGILFMLGMIVIFVGIGFNHIIVARVYLAFLWFDFIVRIVNPKYSPSLLLGRIFVQNKKPEYVGALQKRFAWTIGWFISLPLMWWFVLHWEITFYKVLLCIVCLALTFLESAFSICLGCMIYNAIMKDKAQYCPGGSCEIRKKDPIQTFSPIQKVIATVVVIALFSGIYLFIAKTQSKTFFGQFLHELVLTKADLKKEKDEEFEREAQKEFEEDDDF